MSRFSSWTLCVAVAIAAGCGDSNDDNVDLGPLQAAKICTAGEKTCLDDRTAVVCTDDGLSRIPVQCGIGQKCTTGTCGTDPNALCSSFDDGCMDATTALRCSSTGMGFDVVPCPTGTACVGGGLCQGSCVVGESFCSDLGHLATCADGLTFTTSACDAGKSCVATASDPYDTAACKTSDCTPDANGCDFVCGNKANPMAAGQTTTMSACTETTNGYKWVAFTCPGVTSCNPSGQSCTGGFGVMADCTADCTPGDSRCATDLSIQSCGDDGHWSATITGCNANPLAAAYQCFASGGNHALCGDIVCADGDAGACDDQGKFHACGADGKVAATGVACASGQCVISDTPFGSAWAGGSCVVECSAGDERCAADPGPGSTFQACTNGVWGPPTACAAGVCFDTKSPTGAPRKFCGDCVPGTHQCAGAQIQTCGVGGTFGAATDCTTGVCNDSTLSDAQCLAECFPGKKICLGSQVNVTGTNIPATDSEATCTAGGTIPAPSACAAGSFCRRGPSTESGPGDPGNGVPLGCVVCVGGQNEFGLRDSKCGDDAGTGSGNYVTSCLANSSGWDGATNVLCAGAAPNCQPASNNVDIPAHSGTYCHELIPGVLMGTESAIKAYCLSIGGCPTPPSGVFCDLIGPPDGFSSCPTADGGAVPDCCNAACAMDPAPNAAYCGP
jgi:hypothetical protein